MSKSAVKILILLAAFLGGNLGLYADGGTLQFRKLAGPFTLTLFSMPVPLRVGAADLSVLVQDSQDNALVDGSVIVRVSKAEERDIVARATAQQATNKLLYAAPIELPRAGTWRVQIRVLRGGLSGTTEGEIHVLPEEPPLETFWFYFAVAPLAILLFVLNQWIKRQQRRVRK